MYLIYVLSPFAMLLLLNISCLFIPVNGTGRGGGARGTGMAKPMRTNGGGGGGGGVGADPSSSTNGTRPSVKKGSSSSSTSLADLFAKQDSPHTLADLLAKPQSHTLADLIAEEKQTNKKGGTIAAVNDNDNAIGGEEFDELVCEMKDNEILMGEIFEPNNQQSGDSPKKGLSKNWLARKMRIFNVISKIPGQKRMKELEEKATKLITIKEWDPPMSQIVETLLGHIKAIKSGHTFGPFKTYLSFFIQIYVLRQHIRMDKIVQPFKKMSIREMFAELKAFRKNGGQKSGKNEEKSQQKGSGGKSNKPGGEERLLGILQTMSENIDGNAKLATKIAKSKGKRRKKRFPEFVIALAVLFTVLLVISLVQYIIARLSRPTLNVNVTITIQTTPEVEERLARFHERTPQKIEELKKEGGAECAVCLSEFEEGDEVRPLPACGHLFHDQCIDAWFKGNKTTCPLCRTEQFKNENGKVALIVKIDESPQPIVGTPSDNPLALIVKIDESPQPIVGTLSNVGTVN